MTLTAHEAREALIGGWMLESFVSHSAQGARVEPLGPAPSGLLSYCARGTMSAHLVASEGFEPLPPNSAYTSYFGRYEIDPAKAVVTHHVMGATEPWLRNTAQVRKFRFDGDRLILAAQVLDTEMVLTWRPAA